MKLAVSTERWMITETRRQFLCSWCWRIPCSQMPLYKVFFRQRIVFNAVRIIKNYKKASTGWSKLLKSLICEQCLQNHVVMWQPIRWFVPLFFRHRLCEKPAFNFLLLAGQACIRRSDAWNKLDPWRVGFHSSIITVYYHYIFKPKIFFEGVSFEIEIWRDNWVFITCTFESWKEKGNQNFDHSSTLTDGWKTNKRWEDLVPEAKRHF